MFVFLPLVLSSLFSTSVFASQVTVGSGGISTSDAKSTCGHVQEFSCVNDLCDACAGSATGGRCRNGDNSGGTCAPGTLCNKPTAGHCLENTVCSLGRHSMPGNKHFQCMSVKNVNISQPVVAYQNADCTGSSCFMTTDGEYATWGGTNSFWNCIDSNPTTAVVTYPCRSAGEGTTFMSHPPPGMNGDVPLGEARIIGPAGASSSAPPSAVSSVVSSSTLLSISTPSTSSSMSSTSSASITSASNSAASTSSTLSSASTISSSVSSSTSSSSKVSSTSTDSASVSSSSMSSSAKEASTQSLSTSSTSYFSSRSVSSSGTRTASWQGSNSTAFTTSGFQLSTQKEVSSSRTSFPSSSPSALSKTSASNTGGDHSLSIATSHSSTSKHTYSNPPASPIPAISSPSSLINPTTSSFKYATSCKSSKHIKTDISAAAVSTPLPQPFSSRKKKPCSTHSMSHPQAQASLLPQEQAQIQASPTSLPQTPVPEIIVQLQSTETISSTIIRTRTNRITRTVESVPGFSQKVEAAEATMVSCMSKACVGIVTVTMTVTSS